MAVTFTQIPVSLRFDRVNMVAVLDQTDRLLENNNNKIYSINTQFHVTGENVDTVESVLNALKELGAIDTYQWTCAMSQVDGLRRNYLK